MGIRAFLFKYLVGELDMLDARISDVYDYTDERFSAVHKDNRGRLLPRPHARLSATIYLPTDLSHRQISTFNRPAIDVTPRN